MQHSNSETQSVKKAIKKNIAKAWYKLDKPSYENWLEGRKVSQLKDQAAIGSDY